MANYEEEKRELDIRMLSDDEKRSRFLRLAKEFDNNYFQKGRGVEEILNNLKEEDETIKECLSRLNISIGQYSQLDYKKLVSITNIPYEDKREAPKNPYYFFIFLSNTNLLLYYYHKYEFDRLRDYESCKRLISKYKAVIEDLKAIKERDETIEALEKRLNDIKLNHTFPTIRNIFEDFLHSMHTCLSKRGKGKSHNLTEKNARITNLIIKEYFSYEETFSRNIGNSHFDTFYEHTYMLESEIINLLHKKTSK